MKLQRLLYWEDGHCYMVSNPGDKIWLCEMAGGFTGVVLALYAQGSKDSYADFTNFGYQEY